MQCGNTATQRITVVRTSMTRQKDVDMYSGQSTESTERDDERLPPWSTVVVRHGKKGRTRVVGCFFDVDGGRSGRKKARRRLRVKTPEK